MNAALSKPTAAYMERVAKGLVLSDAKQMRCLTSCLDPLHTSLTQYAGSGTSESRSRSRLQGIKGAYLWGGVGCGKTYLMDLLESCLPQNLTRRRVHFHAFMSEVHKTIRDIKKKDSVTDGMRETTKRLIGDVEVLCFDEMMVTDVADAMILKRLFNSFDELGLCSVVTSNRPPGDLYANGLNRELFLPFVSLLKKRCTVFDMESDVDYRLRNKQTSSTESRRYFSPSDNKTEREAFYHLLTKLRNGETLSPATLVSSVNRLVSVPCAAQQHGVCLFTFQQLCGEERSAIDYEAIAQSFPYVFVTDIPHISLRQSSEVRRLIIALDVFYQHRVKLVCLADADPAHLCPEMESTPQSGRAELSDDDRHMIDSLGLTENGKSTSNRSMNIFTHQDERFMMDRALSRLYEMSTPEYWNRQETAKSAASSHAMYV